MKKLTIMGALLALGTIALPAETYRTLEVRVPFAFSVGNTRMPAGNYHLQNGPSSEIAFLVNDDSGKRVQVLRLTSERVPGKAHLLFKPAQDGGYKLAKVR